MCSLLRGSLEKRSSAGLPLPVSVQKYQGIPTLCTPERTAQSHVHTIPLRTDTLPSRT